MAPYAKGEPLSDWSLAQIKRHCRTIFEAAVDWQLLIANPLKALRFKKLSTKRWYRLPMNVVKELMGHSNISTTAEFYNQVDRDHELKAARVIQRLLDTGKDQPKANEICADFAPKPI